MGDSNVNILGKNPEDRSPDPGRRVSFDRPRDEDGDYPSAFSMHRFEQRPARVQVLSMSGQGSPQRLHRRRSRDAAGKDVGSDSGKKKTNRTLERISRKTETAAR